MRLAVFLLLLFPVCSLAQLADCEGVILHGKKDFVLRWDSDTTTIQKALWQVFGKKNVDVVRDYPSNGHLRYDCFAAGFTRFSFTWSPYDKMYLFQHETDNSFATIGQKEVEFQRLKKYLQAIVNWYAMESSNAPNADSTISEYIKLEKYRSSNEDEVTYTFPLRCSPKVERFVQVKQGIKPYEYKSKYYVMRKTTISIYQSDLE